MKTLLLQFHLLVYPLQTIQNLLFMGNRHVSRESYRRCGNLFAYRIGCGYFFYITIELMLHHIP